MESDFAHKSKVQVDPSKGVRRKKSATSFEPQSYSLVQNELSGRKGMKMIWSMASKMLLLSQ